MTRAGYPAWTYAVLGLVDKVPDSSGHDLAAIADRSLHHFWPGLAHPDVSRVEAAVRQITPEGRAALREWLHAEAPMAATAGTSTLPSLVVAVVPSAAGICWDRIRPARVRRVQGVLVEPGQDR